MHLYLFAFGKGQALRVNRPLNSSLFHGPNPNVRSCSRDSCPSMSLIVTDRSVD